MTQLPADRRASNSNAAAVKRAALDRDPERFVAALETSLFGGEKVSWILGSDEAGMGTWAGDLIVVAVAVPRAWSDSTVTDSKALRDETRRSIVRRYRETVLNVIHRTRPSDIDEQGLWHSVMRAHNEAHEALEVKVRARTPDTRVLHIADGLENAHQLEAHIIPLSKADTFIPAVSLASCFAKVIQCELMLRAARTYPGYGFEKHCGYGTRRHREALARLGVTDIHRKSYRPIRDLLINGSATHRGG